MQPRVDRNQPQPEREIRSEMCLQLPVPEHQAQRGAPRGGFPRARLGAGCTRVQLLFFGFPTSYKHVKKR